MAGYWLKLYTEILDDSKYFKLSDAGKVGLYELLLVAKKFSNDGKIPDLEEIAFQTRKSEDWWVPVLEELKAIKFIVSENEELMIRKFKERQEAIGENQRQYQHRKKIHSEEFVTEDVTKRDNIVTEDVTKRDNIVTGDVTFRDGETETETETETEKEEELELEKEKETETEAKKSCGSAFSHEIQTSEVEKRLWRVYEQEIGTITYDISERIRVLLEDPVRPCPPDYIQDAIRESSRLNKRSWGYAEAIIKRWIVEGKVSRKPDKTETKKTFLQQLAEA